MKSLSDSCERIIIIWLSPLVFAAFCSWSASRNSQPTSFYQSAFFRAKTTQCPVPLKRKALGRDWAQRGEGVAPILFHQRWAFQFFKEEINQLPVVRVYKRSLRTKQWNVLWEKKARFLVWLAHGYGNSYSSYNKDHW